MVIEDMKDQNSTDYSEDSVPQLHMPQLHMIGAGFCGTVWAASEGGSAFKREDGGPFRSLENDYNMHQQVLQSIKRFNRLGEKSSWTNPQIQIPDCERFITATDSDWWGWNLQSFPSGFTACNILQSQRIPPVPERARRLLVEEYCPPQMVDDIMRSERNKDCLIRPYLGRRRVRRRSQAPSRFQAFSLWNFPLHGDQMDELDIPLEDRQQYARIMARTLAILHWIGKIDGNDIEFVLASPNEREKRTIDVITNVLGDHSVWILDFDCCRDMSVDEAGVRRAVTAFSRNDPFYPRPIMEPSLWAAFRVEYLQSSAAAMRLLDKADAEKMRGLPQLFIEMVENEAHERYGNTIGLAED